jgi:hypothetical protein
VVSVFSSNFSIEVQCKKTLVFSGMLYKYIPVEKMKVSIHYKRCKVVFDVAMLGHAQL